MIPEWVDSRFKPSEGFDLLGLRAPAQTISGLVFNGITTISPRIRMLSIRAWAIKLFSESGLPDDESHFAEFMSRIESIMSLSILSVNESTVYIPGSTEALKILNEQNEHIVIKDLLRSAGFAAYVGPSNDLLISFSRENKVPGLTKERGEPLATAFDAVVQSTEIRRLIKENPRLDTVSRASLKELGQVVKIEDISELERNCLLGAMMPAEPHAAVITTEKNRVAFYCLLLELAQRLQRAPSEENVFEAALSPKDDLPAHLNGILDFFLLYRIRDAIAVLHEAQVVLVCSELNRTRESVDERAVTVPIVQDMMDLGLKSVGLLSTTESHDSLKWLDLQRRIESQIRSTVGRMDVRRWDSGLDENQIISLVMKRSEMSIGLLPVVWQLCRLRTSDQKTDPSSQVDLLSRQGLARIGYLQVILPELARWDQTNPPLSAVADWLIKRSVDQHLRIAWSRMVSDMDHDVAVILSDGTRLKYRKDFSGGRTQSRIKDALGWIKQLGLVNTSGLTNKGKEVLQRGYDTLTRLRGEQ